MTYCEVFDSSTETVWINEEFRTMLEMSKIVFEIGLVPTRFINTQMSIFTRGFQETQSHRT